MLELSETFGNLKSFPRNTVLYHNQLYSIYYLYEQAFHKSHLLKLRVAPSETAMTDVYREVHDTLF